MTEILKTWEPRILSVLRIMAALLFVEHGTMKFFAFPAAMPGMSGGLPPLLLVAGLMELVGGALLAVGLFTRPVAFLLSGEMAVGYFLFHAPHSFYPALNMGEPAVLYCFVFLYLAFAGGGAWGVDAMLARNKA
jgi:putative oxidoreductase